MNIRSIQTAIFTIIFIISGCERQKINDSGDNFNKARNVIIFIGDGMGINQVYAGMTISDHEFSLERFPYSGFCKTYSADSFITDSGAGATAIACGMKTNNGMIGVTPDNISIPSILEVAHQNGMSAGILSTSSITHATPACFVAHNSSRENYEDIAKDFLNGTLDLFIGGGEDNFRLRADGADLTTDLDKQGFTVVYTVDELLKTDSKKIAGLLAKGHMPKVSEGRAGVLTLMTQKAIETLSKNKNGFVLMVEGSMIDWGGHEQDLDYVVSEMIDLDDAIGAAFSFAERNENTLIVVTADHETGGLTLTDGSVADHTITATFAGGKHTAALVPIFSYGPGAQKFSGIHDNTFFFNMFINLLDLKK